MLRDLGIGPVFVFDGAPLSIKAETNRKRNQTRKENLAKGVKFLEDKDLISAEKAFCAAIHVTYEMTASLIALLKYNDYKCLVSPYEADPQLAYLLLHDLLGVDCIITEDSDMLAYGCRNVFFKMNYKGYGEQILFEDVIKSTEDLDFTGFTQQQFLWMCLLSGSDYCPSLEKIGIKTAHDLIKTHETLSQVLLHLKASKHFYESWLPRSL